MTMQSKSQPAATAASSASAVVERNDGAEQVVVLDTPIKRGGQDVNEITVRKPKAGALRGATLLNLVQLDVASLQTVLPRVTEPMLAAQEIANLDPADLLALGAAVSSFFMTKAERAALQTA